MKKRREAAEKGKSLKQKKKKNEEKLKRKNYGVD